MSDTFTTSILKLDEPTRNFRTYSSEMIQKLIDEQKAAYYGMLNMPSAPLFHVELDKISHMVSNLRIEGKELVGDVKIFDTPDGKILKELRSAGHVYCFRPAGHGKIDTSGNVTEYTMTSINVVNPDTAA